MKDKMYWKKSSTVFSQIPNHIRGPLTIYGRPTDEQPVDGSADLDEAVVHLFTQLRGPIISDSTEEEWK